MLEGQYIKQWHQNIFDMKTKEKRKAQIFLDAGHLPLLLFCLQNDNKRGKQTKTKKKIKLFTVHVFTLRHFCWGERQLM